eukprot:gene51451-66980_t
MPGTWYVAVSAGAAPVRFHLREHVWYGSTYGNTS